MRQPTWAEMVQIQRKRVQAAKAAGHFIWAPEQLRDILERSKYESIEVIADQYHTTPEDVLRGLEEARGQ